METAEEKEAGKLIPKWRNREKWLKLRDSRVRKKGFTAWV